MATPAAPQNLATHAETVAALVRAADTKEEALAAVKQYCDACIEAGTFQDTYVRKHLTAGGKILAAEGHPLHDCCRCPELQFAINAKARAKKTAARQSSDAAMLQIDLNVELYPQCLRILQANKDGATHVGNLKLSHSMVAVAFIAMTGRRKGEVVDGREGAPEWDWSSEKDEATLSYLLKQGDAPTPHTFPLLCDRELLQHALTTVRGHYLHSLKPGREDDLSNAGEQLNRAVRKLFPAVAHAWLQIFPKESTGDRGFTAHCLRAFYCAKLWSVGDHGSSIYLPQVQQWLGHKSEETSECYEKVRHVKGHVLPQSGTATVAAAAPEPETKGEFIDVDYDSEANEITIEQKKIELLALELAQKIKRREKRKREENV
jgi:hypothetical protein